MDYVLIVLTLFWIVLVAVWIAVREKKNYPPGPTGLPLLGYYPFLLSRPHLKLTELAKKYGPVFRIKVGSENIIFLTEFSAIKEAYAKDAFFGRPVDIPIETCETTKRTNAFFGLQWRALRKFTYNQFRSLMFETMNVETYLKEETEELIEELKNKSNDKSFNFSRHLDASLTSSVTKLTFGQSLSFNDLKMQKLLSINEVIKPFVGGLTPLITFLPWVSAFLRLIRYGNYWSYVKALHEMSDYCSKEITEHEKTFKSNYSRDFVDGFIVEAIKHKNDPDISRVFQKPILSDLLNVFLSAATRAHHFSVWWVMVVTAAHPPVQRRMQAEIDDAMGCDGFLRFVDRRRTPYTHAVIMEVMRWKSIVPIPAMRSTLTDSEVCGYFIPKNSRILMLKWAVDHDQRLWGDGAMQFKPERFLSEDGTKVIIPEHFIPFSIGKRSCPAKGLSEIEMFLYVTSLLHTFSFNLSPASQAIFEADPLETLPQENMEILFKQRVK